MPQQILCPYTPEGAIFYGQHRLARARSRDDSFITTTRGIEMPGTQELAILALILVQVSAS